MPQFEHDLVVEVDGVLLERCTPDPLAARALDGAQGGYLAVELADLALDRLGLFAEVRPDFAVLHAGVPDPLLLPLPLSYLPPVLCL